MPNCLQQNQDRAYWRKCTLSRTRGGRQLSLRPELTAPIIRFYLSDLSNYPMPLKLFCISNCFRYEEPQSGRYREFYQYDVEIIGSEAPESDAELLLLAGDLCRRLGLTEVRFRIGHVGIVRSLLDALGMGKAEQSQFLHLVDKKKMEEAARFLGERKVTAEKSAEIIGLCRLKGDSSALDGIKGTAADYLREVLAIAEGAGTVGMQVDLGVVRGLDYYTGLVFEIDAPELGAEKQVCGGGSYALSQLFGGRPVPSTGMAFGFDRLLLAMERAGNAPAEEGIDAFVLTPSATLRQEMVRIAGKLRSSGIRTEFDLMRRNMSKSLKYASSRGATLAVIVGDKEAANGLVTIRDMQSGEQFTVSAERVCEEARERLPKPKV